MKQTKDFSLYIATANGSGSQSANNILLRTLFRMGLQVGGKNLFPSNIQGLPTWFTIRVSEAGFVGRKLLNEIVVSLNPASINEDIEQVTEQGYFFYEESLKLPDPLPRSDVHLLPLPLKQLAAEASESVKLKKLLVNMVYLGVLARLLKLDTGILNQTISDHFKGKESVIEPNQKAIQLGFDYAENQLSSLNFPYEVTEVKDQNKGKILIDGNSAGALGLLFGGCHFVSWYPITPSSSLVESFENYAKKFRVDEHQRFHAAVIQAEDELSAISMVVGAGWAGARAATATSGPGLSLMAEAAGLAYFAEIPAVIWDVQRVGPSTGLPTRTQQGDLIASYQLSHGDTQHIVLIPGSAEECFQFGKQALDLSERFQTLVIVLSDLDLGMNYHMASKFELDLNFDRGKVLDAQDLEKMESFARYRDVDGDGICYRTLPGTHHDKAAFFTRGTGHTETSAYSESPKIFKEKLSRLKRKYELARERVPQPILHKTKSLIGLIYYGSTSLIIPEVMTELSRLAEPPQQMRVRALPLSQAVSDFLAELDIAIVIEQNRDGQLAQIICNDFPESAHKIRRLNIFDGFPLAAAEVSEFIRNKIQSSSTEVIA